MLQVITPTGDRPEAWKLCQLYMARQTYKGPVEWHVTDDGNTPAQVEFNRAEYAIHIHRLPPMDGNSQARNLLYLLDKIDPASPVVCFEDDDAYHSSWLTHIEAQLQRAELVGEVRARYYNVATRQGRQLNNAMHSSLCSTAMRGGAIETFRQSCKRAPKFIDLDLWKSHRNKKLFDGHRVVGIKGMPGRGGIGMGHQEAFKGQHDPDGTLLRQWIGDDAEHYL